MEILFLRKPLEKQLQILTREWHRQWTAFNEDFKWGKPAHPAFDHQTQQLSWRMFDAGGQSDSVKDFIRSCHSVS